MDDEIPLRLFSWQITLKWEEVGEDEKRDMQINEVMLHSPTLVQEYPYDVSDYVSGK